MPVAAPDLLLDPWWARLPAPGEPGTPARHTLVAVLSAEFPAHTVVQLPGGRRPRDWRIAVQADVDGSRVHRVEVALPGAPLLWYVELPEPAARPAASTVVAFSDPRFPDGTLLDAARARREGVDGGSQVGALRWWPGTGLVHQIYVTPDHRRRGVGNKLSRAVFGMQAARGLPHLHGDGRRTELGEEWRNGLHAAVAARMAPLSEVMPAMTPSDAAGPIRR
ncbi:GNAT family N-acetyltransferase [Blastococcus sp. CT_GayMR16]|uniref:GNAT family N-acetyltransferase n=1 Tax=Blastococcus sp. CT_GayMR16 TaxID=2559607 RepID=UPI0010732A3A|nr:GNAT family N-acetyltransferase [Blastococcus sp. CT_GayMR16]TFV91358.1 N-acetyltransferase [Blastococcus sp. CT_GayMR16]